MPLAIPKVQLQCKQIMITKTVHGCEWVITYLNIYNMGMLSIFFKNMRYTHQHEAGISCRKRHFLANQDALERATSDLRNRISSYISLRCRTRYTAHTHITPKDIAPRPPLTERSFQMSLLPITSKMPTKFDTVWNSNHRAKVISLQ